MAHGGATGSLSSKRFALGNILLLKKGRGTMRRRRRDGSHGTALFWTTGWLFADLLLALAMGFLVANTVGQNPPPVPTVTPAPPTPTPTPHQSVVLDPTPVHLTISTNYLLLMSGDQQTIDSAKQQILNDQRLKGQRAGFVLTFGGSSGVGLSEGNAIADQFNNVVLKALGVVFDPNTVYRSYHDAGQSPNDVEIDVFLFKTVND